MQVAGTYVYNISLLQQLLTALLKSVRWFLVTTGLAMLCGFERDNPNNQLSPCGGPFTNNWLSDGLCGDLW